MNVTDRGTRTDRIVLVSTLLGLAALCGRPYRPVLVSALVMVYLHSLIEHKEYRFIHLSVVMLTILAAISSVDLVQARLARRGADKRRRAVAIAGLCLAWLGLSAFANERSGGPSAMREGHGVIEIARLAERTGRICGIGISFDDRKYIGYAYLAERKPLYVFNYKTNIGTEPFAPDFLRAANAIVSTADGRPPAPYRLAKCRPDNGMTACLFVRPGGCTVTPAGRQLELQQFLRGKDW